MPQETDIVPVSVSAVLAQALAVSADGVQSFVSFCRSHLAEGYNGYTCVHLPDVREKPDFPKNADAIFAIFAARIAFSSFEIRSPLK